MPHRPRPRRPVRCRGHRKGSWPTISAAEPHSAVPPSRVRNQWHGRQCGRWLIGSVWTISSCCGNFTTNASTPPASPMSSQRTDVRRTPNAAEERIRSHGDERQRHQEDAERHLTGSCGPRPTARRLGRRSWGDRRRSPSTPAVGASPFRAPADRARSWAVAHSPPQRDHRAGRPGRAPAGPCPSMSARCAATRAGSSNDARKLLRARSASVARSSPRWVCTAS